MWSTKSKSLTSNDFIKQLKQPDFMVRLFEEHERVMESKVPPKFKSYTSAGPEYRLLFRRNCVNVSGQASTVINASYIDGDKQPDAFIATETPQSAMGAQALWETVWQHGTNIVVMLNKPEVNETGYLYWHPKVGRSLKFGRLTVGTVKSWMALPTLKITKLVVIEKGRDSLPVYHFAYSNWQNSDILPPADDFMKMLLEVRKFRDNTLHFEEYGGMHNQILVHCSNGLDRTMVFCAIDILMSKYFRTKKVNVFSTATKLRQQRFRCLSETNHYYFCYYALNEYFLQGSTTDTQKSNPQT